MDVKLVMFKGDGQRKDFAIVNDRTVIGRGEDCALRVPLLSVSRRHCEVIKGEEELRVRDLASSNGTYVNNRRVNEKVLKAGDRLAIGPVVFTVQLDGEPEQIRPIKMKLQQAGAEAPVVEAEEIVDLEADMGGEESDPIAALEALAANHGEEEEEEDKKKE